MSEIKYYYYYYYYITGETNETVRDNTLYSLSVNVLYQHS